MALITPSTVRQRKKQSDFRSEQSFSGMINHLPSRSLLPDADAVNGRGRRPGVRFRPRIRSRSPPRFAVSVAIADPVPDSDAAHCHGSRFPGSAINSLNSFRVSYRQSIFDSIDKCNRKGPVPILCHDVPGHSEVTIRELEHPIYLSLGSPVRVDLPLPQ